MRPQPQLLHELSPVESGLETHAPILEARSQAWDDESACARLAATLAGRPALADAVVELRGPLGAGKTTFARHLLGALGVRERIVSPTYTIALRYRSDAAHGAFAIVHADFYRFADAREWEDAGLRELYAAPGLKLAEWPENARAWLPTADLVVTIAVADEGRRTVRLEAQSARGLELLGP
mgnify:CR=1 FL=1